MDGIGPYELLEQIGAGSFGRVYQARHRQLDEIRAIKIATDLDFIRQLRKEGRLLSRLRHPRIVLVHDMDVEHDPPYIVMEYVEGGDLRKLLEQGPVPVERAVQIMLDVLEALEHAHSQGVIHRDIKPSNILLDKDGRAKVSDFGLGKVIEEVSSLALQAEDDGRGRWKRYCRAKRTLQQDCRHTAVHEPRATRPHAAEGPRTGWTL